MSNTLLQTSDVTYLRGEAIKALPELVHIHRRSLTSDGQGGFTETRSIAYQNVAARLSAASGGESTVGAAREPSLTLTVTVAHVQDVQQDDRIEHSSGTYEVLSINEGQTWGTVKRCQVRRL